MYNKGTSTRISENEKRKRNSEVCGNLWNQKHHNMEVRKQMAAAIIEEISDYLQKGRAKNVKKLVEEALEQGINPKEILNEGLLAGMMIVGEKFKNNEVFVPEVLVAARAMTAGITILERKAK